MPFDLARCARAGAAGVGLARRRALKRSHDIRRFCPRRRIAPCQALTAWVWSRRTPWLLPMTPVVGILAAQRARQPSMLLAELRVHPPFQFLPHFLQLPDRALALGFAVDHKRPFRVFPQKCAKPRK
jgi:hypothetical protein